MPPKHRGGTNPNKSAVSLQSPGTIYMFGERAERNRENKIMLTICIVINRAMTSQRLRRLAGSLFALLLRTRELRRGLSPASTSSTGDSVGSDWSVPPSRPSMCFFKWDSNTSAAAVVQWISGRSSISSGRLFPTANELAWELKNWDTIPSDRRGNIQLYVAEEKNPPVSSGNNLVLLFRGSSPQHEDGHDCFGSGVEEDKSNWLSSSSLVVSCSSIKENRMKHPLDVFASVKPRRIRRKDLMEGLWRNYVLFKRERYCMYPHSCNLRVALRWYYYYSLHIHLNCRQDYTKACYLDWMLTKTTGLPECSHCG